MGLIRFLFYSVIFYLLIRMFKQLFFKPPADSHVKGDSREKENLQEKHKRNIEDADFEEIKDE